jgi:hypothetical protein
MLCLSTCPLPCASLHNAMTRLHHSRGRPDEASICQGTSYHHGSVSRVLVEAFCPDWTLFCWIVTYLQGNLKDLYPYWAAARLSNQGLALLARFDSLSKASDLDLALTRLHQAVTAAPDGWPGRAAVLRNLGSALQHQGQLATAEGLFRESLAEQERSLGPDHPAVAAARDRLRLIRSGVRAGEAT